MRFPGSFHLRHRDRRSIAGGDDRGFEDPLGLEGVDEVRHRDLRLAPREHPIDVRDLRDEGVLVAQTVGRRPVGVDIRMFTRLRTHDPTPAAKPGLEGVIPPLQFVHAFEVELEGAELAVDFDGVATSKQFFGVQFYLEDMLGSPVDLVTSKAVRKELKPYIDKDRIDV